MTVTKPGRLAKRPGYLADQSLDGLIAASNGLNNFLESNAVYVFSGVRPIGESAVVLDRDGRSTLIVTPAWDEERAAALSATERTIGTDDLAADAQKRGRDPSPRSVADRFRSGCRCSARRWSIASRRRSARCRKPPTNWRAISPASARPRNWPPPSAPPGSPSAATSGSWNLPGPASANSSLPPSFIASCKQLGAEDNFLLMSASQHNLAVRAAGERIFDVGDIILSEITPCYRGQFAQICRTTVIGEPRPVIRDKYAILQDAMAEGLVAGRAGATVADVTRAINGVIAKAGYGDYCRPPYMRVRGHGLGITSDRPGDIVESNERVLESGMVFVMHPNQYMPESGYLMCGEPVVVTPSGAARCRRGKPCSTSSRCEADKHANRAALRHDRLLCVGAGSSAL